MSGAALSPAPVGPRPGDSGPIGPAELFDRLVVSAPPRAHRTGFAFPASLLGHAVVIALLFLVPIFWATPPPDHPDYVRALL